MKRYHALTLGFVAAVSISAVQADPFRPGIQDQIALGKRAKAQVHEQATVLPANHPKSRELRRLGEAMVQQIPIQERRERPFEYSFEVIEDDSVNAFALPGGPIFIYTGLLDRLSTEDQVVGILAHEIVHVRNQHWASAYADNQKRRLGLGLLLGILGAGGTAFDIAAVADTLLFTLPYSRRHETEADQVGFDMMVSGNYNPQGMADVFRRLLEAGGGGPAEFLSTHPDTRTRVNAIENRVRSSNRNFRAQRPRHSSVLPETRRDLLRRQRRDHVIVNHVPLIFEQRRCCPWH